MMRKFVCAILLLSVLAGCSQSPRNGASPSPAYDANRQVKVQQTAPQKKEIMDPKSVSERLEQIATSIPQVQGANCVVFGNTAVVGINLPPEMDRSKVGTIKLAVAEALRKDPYGVDALVTSDVDIATRIRRMRDNMRDGRIISGFAEEMAEIVGRIMPQMPRDTTPDPRRSTEPQMPNSNL